MESTVGDGIEPCGREEALGPTCALLLARIGEGDVAALTEFYDRTAPLVFGCIQRALPGTGAAEEVLIGAFTQVWLRAREYEPGTDPTAWVLGLARTCAIERLRADRPDLISEGIAQPGSPGIPDAGSTPATVVPERQRRARAAWQELPAEQRRILDLALFSGMGHGEIAARTGQAIRTVRARIRQGLIRLSDALAHAPAPQAESRRDDA